jgi:hypothetical protein
MSSTNRSNARNEHISDYYVTPINKIKEFLNEIIKYEPDIFNGYILDPCAGGDYTHPMSYPKALVSMGVSLENIITVDIRKDSLADIREDYLSINCPGDFKLIITNPPFAIAKDIIIKALNDVKDNGFVIMLLRLNYMGGQLREDLWKSQMPKYIFVHNRRMSFTDDGKTDSIEYAHFVWQKGYYPEFSKTKIIYS